jgi:NodT family efflux transporter outer membrane factor (OMF) lipoprotein
LWLAASLWLLAAGCVATRHRIELAPDLGGLDAWTEPTVAEGLSTVDPWWEQLGDPVASELVARALAGNLSLRAALARVEQADGLRRQARAGLFPTLDVEPGINRSRIFVPPPIGAFEQTFWTFQGNTGWEVDVWRRVRSGIRAAEADRAAVRLDAEGVALSLSAQVVEAWWDVRFQADRRGAIEDQLALVRTWEELMVLRQRNGLSTALEVMQQAQQARALETQLPAVAAAEDAAVHRLALLLGMVPSALRGDPELGPLLAGGQAGLPVAPPLPAAGVPADLLTRRPDVQAAQLRALAADWRVVSAVADRLPTLRLTGSVNLQAPRITDLLDGFFWRIAGALATPLVDGGRRRAAVDRARWVREEALLNWNQALLTAIVEVEDALAALHHQEATLAALAAEQAQAEATLALARGQYLQGVTDYLRVLTALSTLQQLALSRLQAERTALSQRVALYRALGGDWMPSLTPPELPDRPRLEQAGGRSARSASDENTVLAAVPGGTP